MGSGGVLQIGRGQGQPAALALDAGVGIQPMTVGRAGTWVVDGRDVAELHGYIYYDGRTLFVQSAVPNAPVLLNGQPVGGEWTPVGPDSWIELGEVAIHFQAGGAAAQAGGPQAGAAHAFPLAPAGSSAPSLLSDSDEYEDDAATILTDPSVGQKLQALHEHSGPPSAGTRPLDGFGTAPPRPAAGAPPQEGPPTAPHAPPQFVPGGGAMVRRDDDESTRFAPVESPSGTLPAPMQAALAPGVLPGGANAYPGMPGAPMPNAGERTGATPTAGSTASPNKFKAALDKAIADFKAASLPKKIILIGSPIFAWAIITAATPKPKPIDGGDGNDVTEADAGPSASASAEVGLAPSADTAPTASNDIESPTDPPQADGGEIEEPGEGPDKPPENGSGEIKDPNHPKDPKKPDEAPIVKKGQTDARRAADAYSRGDLPTALKLYKKLEKEDPKNPAYREAVRIIERELRARGN